MSLKDFMQQLQEQDSDVIYSKPPEDTIQVIPPEKQVKKQESIKIIPPKDDSRPKTIKFKINKKPIQDTSNEKPVVIIPPKNNNKDKKLESSKNVQNVQTKQENNVQNNQIDVEELFRLSDTHPSYKQAWIDTYNKALNSKKDNYATKKCRKGEFMIDNEGIWFFPDNFDIRGKTSSKILEESWLNNLI